MKLTIGLLFISLFCRAEIPYFQDFKLIRNLYYEASNGETEALDFFDKMKNMDSMDPVISGYKGMSYFMLCNYGYNPFNKLYNFRMGKKILDSCLAKNSNDVELRFLRFTIQTNVPALLNYSQNTSEDKEFILNNLENINEDDLFNRIFEYLISSTYCTENDKEFLNKINDGRGNIGRSRR